MKKKIDNQKEYLDEIKETKLSTNNHNYSRGNKKNYSKNKS